MTKRLALNENEIYLENRKIPLNLLIARYKFTGIDMNDIVEYGNGIFLMQYGCKNTPTNSENSGWHWYVLQMCWNTVEYCVQIATSVHSDQNLYIRHKIAGNWQSWKRLAYV